MNYTIVYQHHHKLWLPGAINNTTDKLIVNFLQSIEEEIHTERVSYCPQCLKLKSGTLATILSPQEHINLWDGKISKIYFGRFLHVHRHASPLSPSSVLVPVRNSPVVKETGGLLTPADLSLESTSSITTP